MCYFVFHLRTPNINNEMKFFKSPAFRLGLILVFLSGTTNANAQFFKKLGKAIQKQQIPLKKLLNQLTSLQLVQ